METPPSASTQTPKTEFQKESPAPKAGLLGILGEVSQYAILGAFVLYSVGFLIWHSYLANFGMSSVGFLQTEYLSAAFCYLLIMALFGVPSALLFERAIKWLKNRLTPPSKRIDDAETRKSKAESFSSFVYLWFMLIWFASGAIFPQYQSGTNQILTLVWICVSALFLAFAIVQLVCRWRFTNSPFYKRIKNVEPFNFWFLANIVYGLVANVGVSKHFLVATLFIYPLAWLFLVAASSDSHVKIITIIGIGLALISHAQLFGNNCA